MDRVAHPGKQLPIPALPVALQESAERPQIPECSGFPPQGMLLMLDDYLACISSKLQLSNLVLPNTANT